MSQRRVLLIAALVVLAFAAGYTLRILHLSTSPALRADVFVEQIQQVLKLVTVQGRFSEIYDYQDYWGYDVAPLRKKALIRVHATASVGFDLESTRIEVDEDNRVITISGISNPEILALDTDLDYYDITEGTFNSFSEEDFTRFQREARAIIREKVVQSELQERALRQLTEMLAVIDQTLRPLGWQLHYPAEKPRLNLERVDSEVMR